MQSLAEGLPPEIARQIHPDWRRNEAEYWAVREKLLPKYQDVWVAFADGAVIASGRRPVEVFHEAHKSGRHPYVTCVGREYEPTKIRRVVLLGREVLNRIELLFRGPAGEVVVNP